MGKAELKMEIDATLWRWPGRPVSIWT